MAFLFQRPPVAHSPAPAFHDEDSAGQEIIRISHKIWSALLLAPEESATLSVSRAGNRLPGASELPSIICRGVLDPSIQSISVPKSWQTQYPHIFSTGQTSSASAEPTHSITTTHPVVLSEVIFSALSDDAYAAASSDPSMLEEWLQDGDVILREGATYTYTREGPLAYKLIMASPVQQGIAQRGSTKLYVSAHPTSGQDGEIPEVDAIPDMVIDEADSDSEPEKGDFEIGEDFLAGSVLRSFGHSSSSPSISGHPTNGDLVSTGEAGSSAGHLHLSDVEWTCRAHPLQASVSALEDECAVYVRTSELSRIGVLDGDWAIVRFRNGCNYRLARVHANDAVAVASGAYLSPQLLFNIDPENRSASKPEVSLRPSPFGSRRPTIPVAKTVTVARVASAFSTDRAYQPLFLQALQDYFKETTRLVKQGDVITIGINTDNLLAYSSPVSDEGHEEAAPEVDLESVWRSSCCVNELVYFIITNVEHSVPSRLGETSSLDMYVGATVGELGCWIDTAVTRMVQTGIEHSRIPAMAQYLGTAYVFPPPVDTVPDQDTPFGKLLALSSAALNRRAVDYHLQLSILLQGPRGVGKATIAGWVAQQLGIHLLEVDCYDVIGETDAKTEGTLRARFEKASSCSPCILLLKHIDAFAQSTQNQEPGKEPAIAEALRDCINDLQPSWNLTGFPVLLFGTTDNHDRVPPKVLSCFKHEVIFEAPGESERYDILCSALATCKLAPDVSVKNLAVQTAALVAADLVDLVSRAQSAAVLRSTDDKSVAYDVFSAGIPLTAADFESALGKARASYSESIGAPKIPSVSWDDVGGLAHVKADILDTIQLPLEHPELFADGLKQRSGVLLYGPPGTGKTLIAKAVATSCALNFFSVKGPELLNMYIGESEANVRRVFQRARDARPCVIFFDELDSVAPKRGNHGDSGGVMDRIVSQLLAELDGLSGGKAGADVFVIGATNRPDLLDPALLRPGRFDRMLYLGVSNTHEAQLNILQALTRKFKLHPDLKLERIAEQCPFHYTGADFYALCADALLKAMSRKAEELEETIAKLNTSPPPNSPHPYPLTPQYYLGELATAAETEVLVSEEDFSAALRELVPSVSQEEMEHYARIQQRFSNEALNGNRR
ncbi:AAA-domain-containing protein [Lentinus tigrinus ALCF2SS1-7]|uniref:Peroxisomal ATPase PEX6 n=1 Tax=Lentinus tigrinus ALCF2SS1-6 TaxID=1328759 RepID=A0A5C2SPK8_9APHY|nr:AAA-domain-containing protein [Lentinus tigrinus ALCF2SS1-6]RPD79713.1 AAA-domain-containing protein [Lentinus tigrinus ALCF2SS1-7]